MPLMTMQSLLSYVSAAKEFSTHNQRLASYSIDESSWRLQMPEKWVATCLMNLGRLEPSFSDVGSLNVPEGVDSDSKSSTCMTHCSLGEDSPWCRLDARKAHCWKAVHTASESLRMSTITARSRQVQPEEF